MDTVRHAINAFRHYVEDPSGKATDDFTAPNSLIYYYLNMVRQTITYQNAKGLGISGMSDGLILTIPCLELEKVDVVESPFVPATGCYFLKGKFPLPQMLEGIPIRVTTLSPECQNCDKELKEFSYVAWADFQYKINSRIEAQNRGLYYTIKNYGNHTDLYIYTNSDYDDIKAVAITLIPKNPIDVINYPKCGEGIKKPCSYLDDKFIIEQEIEEAVFRQTLDLLSRFKTSNQHPSDILNNSNNDGLQNAPKS